jgi:hypothetical protein
LYWGWPLCTRTTYRFLENFEKMPKLIRGIQKYTPFFRNGYDKPFIESTFANELKSVDIGCGYISALDEHNRVFNWGDNYAVISNDDLLNY